MTHMPTPWQFTLCDDGRPMVHTTGDVICVPDPNHGSDGELPDAMDEANFRHIVHAVNSLHALVKALEDARACFEVEYHDDGEIACVGHASDGLRKMVRILDAALASHKTGG